MKEQGQEQAAVSPRVDRDPCAIEDYDVMVRMPEELNVGQLNRTVRELRERLYLAKLGGGAPYAMWTLGCQATREAVARAVADEVQALANRGVVCGQWSASHLEQHVRSLPLPTPDGRRYRVYTREVRDCTRCHHEAEASQPGKPDEFSCQVMDCCCIHKHGRCVVAA
jgi:hypothetical protein